MHSCANTYSAVTHFFYALYRGVLSYVRTLRCQVELCSRRSYIGRRSSKCNEERNTLGTVVIVGISMLGLLDALLRLFPSEKSRHKRVLLLTHARGYVQNGIIGGAFSRNTRKCSAKRTRNDRTRLCSTSCTP